MRAPKEIETPVMTNVHGTRTSLHQFLAKKFEISRAGARLTPMEGLRGLAALMVFFVHFNTLFGAYYRPGSFLSMFLNVAGHLGHLGVDLFFILSGFLMYGVVFEKRMPYLRFVGRRVERLYPVFLSIVALYLVLSVFFPAESKIPLSPRTAFLYLVSNLLLLPGIFNITPLITVAWSLSYEWFFYLTLPVLIAMFGFRNRSSMQRISFVLVASAGVLLLAAAGFGEHFRLLGFGPGIILWEVVTYRSLSSRLKSWGEYVTIAAFLIDIAGIGLIATIHGPTSLVLSNVPYAYWSSFYVAAFFLVLYTLFYDGILKRIFSWDWLRWFGNISYSYYLVHGITLLGLTTLLSRVISEGPRSAGFGTALLLASFATTLCSAVILFLLVEKPFSLAKAARPSSGSALDGNIPAADASRERIPIEPPEEAVGSHANRERSTISIINSAALPYIVPFCVFVGFMGLEKVLPLPPQTLYPIRCVLTLLALVLISRPVIRLRPSRTFWSILLGIGVFVLWIVPDLLWGYRGHWLFSNAITGHASSSFPVAARTDWTFLAFRVLGSAALVPIIEELFWRGWMMRWLIRPEFLKVPLGTYAASSFWIVALLFASEHGPYWEVGLVAGIAYNWWLVHTRSLADCILAHAVTNAMLAGYVLGFGAWQYWL